MKYTVIAIIFAGVVIGGAILLGGKGRPDTQSDVNNVTMQGDKQIIEITAKGGYYPRQTIAKANVPTILKMKTEGTFDCSSAIRIPSLDYSTNLGANGVTEIEIPPQKPGSILQGLCAMGMYNFQIGFN